jgi:hypothetical protein
MKDYMPVGAPMAAKSQKDTKTEIILDKKRFPFPELIGELLFCSNCTRPDITVAVSHMAKYMLTPTVGHWKQAKRILRYLKGTTNFCITCNGKISTDMIMWQDASFADGDDRRSRTGFVVMMCGSVVAWGSKLQSTVALSTVEAEYMAICAAAQEALFLR